MTWIQFASGAAMIAGCVALFIWGPESASAAATGLGSAAGVILAGGFAKRGPT